MNEPQQVANSLNEYFVNSITEINRSISHRPFVRPTVAYPEWSNFMPITYEQLCDTMRHVRNKSGTGNVNLDVMSHSMSVIGHHFLDIINESLTSGICPTVWKMSLVTPIPKVPGTTRADELRPVNRITVDDKVCEVIVRDQLRNHVITHQILTPYQSAFRSNHSCESAINLILFEWKRELEEKIL